MRRVLAGVGLGILLIGLAACIGREPPRSGSQGAAPGPVVTATSPAGQSTSAAPSPTAPPSPSLSQTPGQLERVVAASRALAVLVWTQDAAGVPLTAGTGISLGGGSVLTAYHVIQDAPPPRVRFANGQADLARIVGVDAGRDLALLQTSGGAAPGATLVDSSTLRQGETLVAFGYPHPEQIGIADVTVTSGIFSARRQVQGVWYVQTNAALNEGNSGGPLVDGQGRVVGMVDFGVRGAEGLHFAVAGEELRAFIANPSEQPIPPSATPLPTFTPVRSATSTPVPVSPTPRPTATPVPSVSAPRGLGLEIRAPTDGATVPEQLVVRGVQTAPAQRDAHIWLFVGADVPGSRWYPCPRGELVPGPSGAWECEVYLGGQPGTRHIILVGVADERAQRVLTEHLATRPGQPLFPDEPTASLPLGFIEEDRVAVVRR
jgi:S1-C subfamily serine protease